MLYIVLAYLMLLCALSHAVFLHNASFFAIDTHTHIHIYIYIYSGTSDVE